MFVLLANGFFGILVMGLLIGTNALHWGWAILLGVLAFAAGQGLTGYLLQRRVKVAMEAVQHIMVEGQKRMQQKVKMWQTRPPGSMKDAQLEMERDQKRIVEQALEASKSLERFNRWVPLMEKQIATLRLQLYWSVKNFKKVDELMPLAIYMEPTMINVKIARLFMLEADIAEIEKFFKKQVSKLRYGQGVVLYSLMAWIYLQRNDLDKANKILIEACEKMENDVVKRNRELLANNRANQFSNTGLGEEWYALHLEQPKMKQQRQSTFAKRHF
jgi:tetratricopeptide (TPR) repeat protein